MDKGLNKNSIYKFYFFKWREKFAEKQKYKNFFVWKD